MYSYCFLHYFFLGAKHEKRRNVGVDFFWFFKTRAFKACRILVLGFITDLPGISAWVNDESTIKMTPEVCRENPLRGGLIQVYNQTPHRNVEEWKPPPLKKAEKKTMEKTMHVGWRPSRLNFSGYKPGISCSCKTFEFHAFSLQLFWVTFFLKKHQGRFCWGQHILLQSLFGMGNLEIEILVFPKTPHNWILMLMNISLRIEIETWVVGLCFAFFFYVLCVFLFSRWDSTWARYTICFRKKNINGGWKPEVKRRVPSTPRGSRPSWRKSYSFLVDEVEG